MKNSNSKILVLSLLIAGVIIFLYLLLMYGWISLNTSEGAPGYVLKEPLRQFFYGSLLLILALSVPLNRICMGNQFRSKLLLSLGGLMTVIGLIGMLVILPKFGVLAYPGGLTPDFGHTLTYENFTGALWLFLLFAGALIYVSGYPLVTDSEWKSVRRFLPAILGFSSYYVGAYIYDFISRVQESGSLSEKFWFSLIFALVVAFFSWLFTKPKEK